MKQKPISDLDDKETRVGIVAKTTLMKRVNEGMNMNDVIERVREAVSRGPLHNNEKIINVRVGREIDGESVYTSVAYKDEDGLHKVTAPAYKPEPDKLESLFKKEDETVQRLVGDQAA